MLTQQNYRAPLLAVADSTHPLLDEKSIRTIFYGVDELQELHSRLYAKFEERAENWSCDVCVGDLFIELVSSSTHSSGKLSVLVCGSTCVGGKPKYDDCTCLCVHA